MTPTNRRFALKKALVAAVLGIAVLAVSAAPALAGTFTVQVPAPPAVVGKTMILTANGTMPPEDVQFPYWFSLIAIPASVMPDCPPDLWEAVQIGADSGGGEVTRQQGIHPNLSGAWSIPVAVTPTSPGSVLLCGYVDDGMTNTLAATTLHLTIQARSSSAPPRHVKPVLPPEEVRRGIRSCLVLLGPRGGRHCIRQAVKRANASCRKRYHSHTRQAKCIRAVRRMERKLT
jgi:hypothetical protein